MEPGGFPTPSHAHARRETPPRKAKNSRVASRVPASLLINFLACPLALRASAVDTVWVAVLASAEAGSL